MASNEQKDGEGGAVGFLFGNIDKKGRLDEDYLDDETKDNIDHVGSKLRATEELKEIEALPPRSGPVVAPIAGSDDENYDDDATDFYEEDEMVEENTEAERKKMASIALRKGLDGMRGTGGDGEDDENYDDDDDDDSAKPKPPTATTPTPGTKPSTLAPFTSPKPGTSSPRKADATPTKLAPTPVSAALLEQRRLMAAAREAIEKGQTVPGIAADPPLDGHDSDEEPVRFSQLFTRPVPKLKFRRRKRKPLGLQRDDAEVKVVFQDDDAERLVREPEPLNVDPVGVVLALDARNVAGMGGEERLPGALEESVVEQGDDYVYAAAPMASADSEGEEGRLRDVHALVEQVDWEKNIVWGDDEEDYEYEEDVEENGDVKMADANGDDADDNDDDDMFDDPVDLGPSSGKKPEQKPSEKEGDVDSDEDIEWEDGDMGDAEDKPADKPAVKPPESSAPLKPALNAKQEPTLSPANTVPRKESTDTKILKLDDNANNTNEGTNLKNQESIEDPTKKSAVDIVDTIIAPNRDLVEGTWVEGVVWDSESDSDASTRASSAVTSQRQAIRSRFGRLILDMNDPNMIFEQFSDDNETPTEPGIRKKSDSQLSKTKMKDLLFTTGTQQVHQLLEADRFNISNDLYYASGQSNFLKVDRRSILRGLQNAPPAVKCQTTRSMLTDTELTWFRRPKLRRQDVVPKGKMELQPLRRRRPKGGNAQIAGQVPKKKSELMCSAEKDSYRVSLYEYTMERQPSILPIPGMASRIVTYARKKSSAEAAQASKNAAGTAEADTVFMSPEEPPPVNAGNIEADGKPLSVIESHVYSAPCVKTSTSTTDFLLVMKGHEMHVREIDSVVSVGMTEPKVEVMTPNTERYKKFTRDRVSLWIMREFARQRKENMRWLKKASSREAPPHWMRDPPYIEKERIFEEFPRRRIYPETALIKLLKDGSSRNQNGKFYLAEEPQKGIDSREAREAELLRTITPQECASFESMESGWDQLISRGVHTFTYPSQQGNILAAAEKSGHEAGKAVGTYIKCHLLKSPWYQSANILAAHRTQRKDLLQVLALARIVNDLKEGGTVMESRLMSLSGAEMSTVLSNHYRVNAKKIPLELEKRRAFVRETATRKTKQQLQDLSNYSNVIRGVLKKHRDAGLAKGAAIAAIGTAMSGGTFLGLPLDVQRNALEDGDVSELPIEREDYFPESDGQKIYDAAVKVLGKRRRPVHTEEKSLKKAKTSGATGSVAVKKDISGGGSPGNTKAIGRDHESRSLSKKEHSKKVRRLKVSKTVTGEDGKTKRVTTILSNPREIEEYYQKKKAKQSATGEKPDAGGNKLKINIDLKRLSQAGKAGAKKGGAGQEKKSKKKASSGAEKKGVPGHVLKSGEKGQLGKIKINKEALNRSREENALKRKRSQYSEDMEFPAKKIARTSRRKRNGTVQLNNIFEEIEKKLREVEGYCKPDTWPLKIVRLNDGESPPPGVTASILVKPPGTGLDFTVQVTAKDYDKIVKKPIFLNLVRQRCKKTYYKSTKEFLGDLELMVENAKVFNKKEEDHWVIQHGEILLDVAREDIDKRKDEIKSIEEQVKIETAEAKAAAKDKKNKKKGGSKKKQGGKAHRKVSSEVVEITDDGAGSAAQTPGPQSSAPQTPVPQTPTPVIALDSDGPIDGAAGPDLFGAGVTAVDVLAIDEPVVGPKSGNLVLNLDDPVDI